MSLGVPQGSHRVRGWRLVVLLAILVLALAMLLVLALMHGIVAVPRTQVLSLLTGDPARRVDQILVLEVRLPRALLGMLCGAALAATGCLTQAALRNDLAEPGLLGVSAGAALMVAAVVVLEIAVPPDALTGLAMLGGCAVGLLVLAFAQGTRDPVRIILLGAALSALCGAATVLLLVLGNPGQVQAVFAYMAGSLAGRGWSDLHRLLPWLALGLPLTLLLARPLNLLRLGEELAAGLGLRVFRLRLLSFALAIAILAPVVAIAGPIGFVALVAPHLARGLLGHDDMRQVLPLAMLIGACLLTASDLAARSAAPPLELPVGLVLTAIGAPAAILLLRRLASARASG